MTTMHRTSHGISMWVPLMLAIVLVVAIVSGVLGGVEMSAPSIGFEPPGFPEAIPDPVPAHVLEMNVYGETGVVTELPPIHIIEQEIAGG